VHGEQLVWQIVNASDAVLLRSHRAPERPLVLQHRQGFVSVDDEWRVYGMPFDDRGRMLYVAQSGAARTEARLEAAEITAGCALLVGLLCALWLRSRVRGELAPIVEMSAAVAQFDPLRPGMKLPAATRGELVPMRDAIVDLGTRLADRISSERAFSAHAAHALRTPLAGMVAQLAVAQRTAPAEVQPQLARTREAADRLRRVVSALLTLFRAGGEVVCQRVELADLIEHLPVETMTITVHDAAPVQADPDLLAAALMNLLDNSLRHGATTASIATRAEPAGMRIVVSDNGAGMSGEDRVRVQAALDEQRYEGHTGLGLMLADLVARAHGGRLLIVPSASGCSVEIGLGACRG
jgi:two-component system OmpR family sensor kinase